MGAGVQFELAPGVRSMRVLVALGCGFLAVFLRWFFQADPIGYPPLFWLLTVALGFKLLRMLHEWYHYVNVRVPVAPSGAPGALRPSVDMLTTAYPGEPYAMIVGTLAAMAAVRYPHTSYLCDEGDDPRLRAACARLGVVHVARAAKTDAKAGNINHALARATGALCVVLDPDHVPTPDFLDRVLPYFADPAVGYVQVVQAYGNQVESLVARGAAEQTYHFYGPLMMGMNAYNTAQAIGANCTFRRAALDGIGGHAAGLTEDMHTAMRLHAAGWKSIYAPVVVSRGLVPATLGAFYAQQLKWSRGAFDLLLHVYPKLFQRFSWRQRLHYLTLPLYFMSGVVSLIDFSVPALALALKEMPWHVSMGQFMLHLGPVMAFALLIRLCAQRWLREPHEAGLHLAGGLLRVSTWWVYTLGLVYALVNKRVPYLPTPKEGELRNEWLLCLPNLVLALACAAVGGYQLWQVNDQYTTFMALLSLWNAAILLAAVAMAQHQVVKDLLRAAAGRAPARRGVLALARRAAAARQLVVWRVRRAAVYVAGGLALFSALASSAYWAHQPVPTATKQWQRYVGAGLRTGAVLRPGALSPGFASAETTGSPDIIALNLAGGPMPYLRAADRRALSQQPALPMLSWPVTALQANGVSSQDLKAERRNLAKGPLLMRPLLTAPTASAYRDAWRQLVRRTSAVGYAADGWVWSPPCADSVARYFPGAGYVHWVAVDCTQPAAAADPAAFYAAFRRQQAGIMALHSKPVLLIVAKNSTKPMLDDVQKWSRRYPEIKAVIFDANNAAPPTPLAGAGPARRPRLAGPAPAMLRPMAP